MRRRQLITTAAVALLTFIGLQAFVGNRYGNGWNRARYGFGQDGYYHGGCEPGYRNNDRQRGPLPQREDPLPLQQDSSAGRY